MNKSRTIMLLNHTGFGASIPHLEGIRRYVKEAGWKLESTLKSINEPDIPQLIDFWNADGCIVQGGGDSRYIQCKNRRVPVVYIDADVQKLPKGASYVYCDGKRIAEFAAKELLSSGRQNFAYAGIPFKADWSEQRRSEFKRILAMHNLSLRDITSIHINKDPEDEYNRLVRELSELPLPAAVFAANDHMAYAVVAAARNIGLRIPEDIAIVGVDNEPDVSDRPDFSITSVMVDFEKGGYLAAQLLGELMDTPKAKSLTATYGATGIFRRSSTAVLKDGNPFVIRAMSFIRDHVSEGIGVSDVVEVTGVSRRTAEIRFREMTGKTIHEAIREARLDMIESLTSANHKISYNTLTSAIGMKSSASLWRLRKTKK